MTFRVPAVVVTLGVLVAACGGEDAYDRCVGPGCLKYRRDAGAEADAGDTDAGTSEFDGGARIDAGAAFVDAGTELTDAGPSDSGVSAVDAGNETPDSGIDAGVPSEDAGTLDAGLPDAGAPIDCPAPNTLVTDPRIAPNGPECRPPFDPTQPESPTNPRTECVFNRFDPSANDNLPCGIGPCTGHRSCLQLVTDSPYGQLTPCTGGAAPSPEVIDCRDNDCNGLTDDVPENPDGGTIWQTCGLGACRRTMSVCSPTWQLQACEPFNVATAETCNRLDDDCDGTVDDVWNDHPPCGLGVCQEQWFCPSTNPQGTIQATCTPSTPMWLADGGPRMTDIPNPNFPGQYYQYSGDEVCNDGLDNDCNGQVDENTHFYTDSNGVVQVACY